MDPLKHPRVKRLKKGKDHYFVVTNEHGDQSLLSSKAYKSAVSRDNGLHVFIKNLDNLHKKTKEGKRYFVIKAGNNQELARSSFFETFPDMEKAIEWMLREFRPENKGKKAAAVETGKKEQRPINAKSEALDQPPKYSFRLEFYFPNSHGPLRGRIEYSLKRDKKTFEGFDLQAIGEFLRAHLPQEHMDLPATGPEEKKNVPAAEPIAAQMTRELQQMEKAAPAPEQPVARSGSGRSTRERTAPMQEVDFQLIEVKTGEKAGLNISKSSHVEIRLDPEVLPATKRGYTDLFVTVSAASIMNKGKILLGRFHYKTADEASLRIPLLLLQLRSSELYKIELAGRFSNPEGALPPLVFEGSKMARVN